jgi:ABC-type cobalamin transport system permease subunit
MSPETHLFGSWIIAAKTTNNLRDCRLVTLAGILPDADGLGLLADWAGEALGRKPTFFYQNYHHYILHGAFGALLVTAVLTCFARQRGRVALLSLLVFHLHLLCDFVGSRGPSATDLWPIYYLGPFTMNSMCWYWTGQWRLDGWQNRYLTLALFFWSLWLATELGHSFVGVFSRRADEVFVSVLRKWRTALAQRTQR